MIGVVKYDKAQCGTLCFVVGSSFPEKWPHWKKKSIKVAISKVNQSMLRCGTLFFRHERHLRRGKTFFLVPVPHQKRRGRSYILKLLELEWNEFDFANVIT